jgi:hypothetical protein
MVPTVSRHDESNVKPKASMSASQEIEGLERCHELERALAVISAS